MTEDISWSHFFRIPENVFQSFCTKFLSLFYMISLAYKISHCLSANLNPELQLRSVICTGVTLFALVPHLNCTVFSQSESSNFFMCIITCLNFTYLVIAFCSVSPHLSSSSRNTEWPGTNTTSIQRRVWIPVKISLISYLSKNSSHLGSQGTDNLKKRTRLVSSLILN